MLIIKTTIEFNKNTEGGQGLKKGYIAPIYVRIIHLEIRSNVHAK